MMSKIAVAFLMLLSLTSCSNEGNYTKGKYTVWVGGDIVQTGYQANEVLKNDGLIEFTDLSTGRKITVPVENLYSIKEN